MCKITSKIFLIKTFYNKLSSSSILAFEFIKELGRGHYGKALLVKDKIFNKKLVLKEIPLEIYENHDLLKNEHLIHSTLK